MNKNFTNLLNEEEQFQLEMQLDNYSMVDDSVSNLTLEELVENNYNEFTEQEDYDSYYEFLSDKLEELLYKGKIF